MTSILHQAITKLSMRAEDATWSLPLSFILLMIREHMFTESPKDKQGIQLSTIEAIDNMNSSSSK